MDLETATSSEIDARLAELRLQDATAGPTIAALFTELHLALGERWYGDRWDSTNPEAERLTVASDNLEAKGIFNRITEVRRGILRRRQQTTKISIEVQRRRAS